MSAKVAIVAGAGGGVGQATTATLAAGGLTVVAIDRNEQAVRQLPHSLHREVGPPDVLVNTLGTFRPGDALSTTPEMLRLMIDVNLGPALWLSQAVAPHMPPLGSGAIVAVAARH